MIINSEEVRKFEQDLLRKEKADMAKNFRIVDALYREAVALGVFPLRDPLDGLGTDIRIAGLVNSVSESA